MKIKCTVKEFKELLKNETSVAVTTDVAKPIVKPLENLTFIHEAFRQI